MPRDVTRAIDALFDDDARLLCGVECLVACRLLSLGCVLGSGFRFACLIGLKCFLLACRAVDLAEILVGPIRYVLLADADSGGVTGRACEGLVDRVLSSLTGANAGEVVLNFGFGVGTAGRGRHGRRLPCLFRGGYGRREKFPVG